MIRIEPGLVQGSLQAPPSKSMMQRAVAAACLAAGTTRIQAPSYCDDGLAALRVASALGAVVCREDDCVLIRGRVRPPAGVLDCGESGLCIRMFAPLAALFDVPLTLEAGGSLAARPVDMIEAPLRQLGAEVRTAGGRPPIHVTGPIRGGDVDVDGSTSSQFLTGLLMALPCCPGNSRIRVRDLKSRPYVRMTLELLESFGIRVDADANLAAFRVPGGQTYLATDYTVEGDWSGAAFLLAAGALAGRVELRGLRLDSAQADRAILDVLRRSGARVEGHGEVLRVERDEPRAFTFDATECPDLFPPIVALACHCPGVTELRGASRLRHKESDRAAALRDVFSGLGVRIEVDGDTLRVHGTDMVGGEVDAHGDHRIAMAAATAALGSREGVVIHGERCVAKSFPDFFERLEEIRS